MWRSGRCAISPSCVRTRQVTVGRADADVPGPAASATDGRLNNVVTFLDDLALAEAARRRPRDRRRPLQRPAARPAVGLQGHHHGSRGSRPPGARRRSPSSSSTTTRASSRCCAMLAPCSSPSSPPASSPPATTGSAARPKPVGSDAGIERIVGRPGLGHRRRVRRLRHRHRNQRIDPEPGGALRRRRPASDVRPHQPLRRDGAVVDAGSARTVLPPRRRLRRGDAGGRQARRPRHERDRSAVQLGRRARRADAQGRHPPGVVRRADRAGGQVQQHSDARGAARDSA